MTVMSSVFLEHFSLSIIFFDSVVVTRWHTNKKVGHRQTYQILSWRTCFLLLLETHWLVKDASSVEECTITKIQVYGWKKNYANTGMHGTFVVPQIVLLKYDDVVNVVHRYSCCVRHSKLRYHEDKWSQMIVLVPALAATDSIQILIDHYHSKL